MLKQPLRFVLLCDGLELNEWQERCLNEAIESNLAELVAIVQRAPVRKLSLREKWSKRLAERRHFLWRLFNRLYVDLVSSANRAKTHVPALRDVPVFVDEPVRAGRYSENLSSEAIAFVRSTNPDFILRFGFGILAGEILSCAKLGVWSYHHGDPSEFRGQPPGFWEIMFSRSTAGVVLQVLGDELDAGRILHQGHFQVTPHSYAKTRDTLYFGASSWVRRACADILGNGQDASVRKRSDLNGSIYKQPTNLDMIRFISLTIRNFIKMQFQYKLHRQNWNCGIIPERIEVVAGLYGKERQRDALRNAHWMPLARGTFQADPFGYELEGGRGVRVLFELFRWPKDRGEIAARNYRGGKFGQVEAVLDAPTHLSYPSVIKVGGSLHLVPEHSAAGNISAFRLNKAGVPDKKTTIFARCELLDSTIIEFGGKFWMFALDEGSSKNTDLHIYFAEEIFGSWRAHPLNPVKSDVRSSRPAGTPFIFEGRLFRPAQNCANHYGSAVTLNEVLVLTESAFREEAVARVEPSSESEYPYALHTLSSVGDFTLIDGARNELLFRI